ncbi:MAG: hypothetical protein ACI9M9_000949 [Flavobacteriaceae bacterium]|jgi:hypothetical protein
MYSINKNKISLVLFSMGILLVYSCRENPKTDDKTTTIQTETTAPVKKSATPVKSADNIVMNPAHGQPGHRCDISVGAPLNSTPTPVKTNSQTSDVVLDSGGALPKGSINPAHGQPGHRCDVSVGEVLQ